MSIKKFKSFEEAREDLWCLHPDEKYYESVREFFNFASKFIEPDIEERGIRKFKSIEELHEYKLNRTVELAKKKLKKNETENSK